MQRFEIRPEVDMAAARRRKVLEKNIFDERSTARARQMKEDDSGPQIRFAP